MANKLGAAFLRCSLGPLHYAGGCILASKVADGLRELSADNLHGGFRRGVEEAAKQTGVGVADVERLLPVADVGAAAARLDTAQRNALVAWSAHAGHIGGLLKGVADLTVDGRAPDVSNFLERLSKKVVRDPALAEPLQVLAQEVACWLNLVERCGELLADGGVLARAYRRRQVRQAVIAAAGVAVVAVGLVFGLRLRAARARVDAVLSAADPCAALALDAADLARASSAQEQRAASLRVACEEQRKREEQTREEQRRREEQARAETQRRKDHEARCEALAERLAGSGPTADDEALAPGGAGLLGRIARRSLERGDLVKVALPCGDTPAGVRIGAEYAAAVVASPAAWANAEDVSARVHDILVEHRAELPSAPKQQLVRTADNLVKRAMIRKSPEIGDQAGRICKLKDDLGVGGAKFCGSLAALHAAGKL